MRIYGEIDRRLDAVVKFDRRVLPDQPFLLVIHPNDTERWIADELSERLKPPNCRGVLLVKGVARAGISEEQFSKLKSLYGNRFHISARAVGTTHEDTKLSGAQASRFARFFRQARSRDLLDWNILDPPWPESLVAVYLLAKVMSVSPEAARVLEGRRAQWGPIWQEANREYKTLIRQSLKSSLLDSGSANDVAAQIGAYLRTTEFTFPSELSQERGRLRHLWLKNQVLALNEDYTALMHTKPSLREARESFESKIRPDGEFDDRLNDVRRIVRQMGEGFSPAQIVDLGPLEQLSPNVRQLVKNISHDLYLRQTMIAELGASLAEVIAVLAQALKDFSTAWFKQPPVDETLIRSKFAHFQLCAKALQEKLSNLPQGIVLP